MRSPRLPLILASLGVAIMLCSWVWPHVVGGRRAWTEAEATELQFLGAQYHELKYEYHSALAKAQSGKNVTDSPSSASTIGDQLKGKGRFTQAKQLADRFAQVEERYLGLNANLEKARTRGHSAATAMFWGGLALTIVGAIGHYSQRQQ